MSQSTSTNHSESTNDRLVNKLIHEDAIRTINVEKVFRSVNLGIYYNHRNKINNFRDWHWKLGDGCLSAPNNYATALECLDLRKGHKFLNIGSGMGFFSTLAGLLLGINGVNHGIEILDFLIRTSYQKLEEFKQNSAAIDYFEFCEPIFIEGNAYGLLSVGYYDRVYCGAGVTKSQSSFMKNLIKIGGVLVMPLEGTLVKVIRINESSWKTIKIGKLAVANLVVPKKKSTLEVPKFPAVQPLSLLKLCRSSIRTSIRDSLIESNPTLQMRTKCKNESYDQKLSKHYDITTQYLEDFGTNEKKKSRFRKIIDGYFGSKNSNESDAKKESSEAGCSKQNKTLPEKPENTSAKSSSDIWDAISSDSSESDYEGNDKEFRKVFRTLVKHTLVREFVIFRFLNKRDENQLSELLKDQIDLLPVPDNIKMFLNYNKVD